jgi:hypothetical protein
MSFLHKQLGFTKEQEIKFDKWNKEQNNIMTDNGQKKLNVGAIGGHIKYKITPTGIGTSIVVKNTITKSILDLTEYDKW